LDALDVPIDLFAAKALLYWAADWLGAVPRYSSLVEPSWDVAARRALLALLLRWMAQGYAGNRQGCTG
jgi:hypothetical protein